MIAAILCFSLLGQTGGRWVCNGKQCVWVPDAPAIAKPLPAKIVPPPPPIPVPPVVRPLPKEAGYLFGVDNSKRPDRDRYSVAGHEVTADQMASLVGGLSDAILPDDCKMPHLSLFGKTPQDRESLEKLIASEEAKPLKDHYRIQVYDASHSVDQAMVGSFGVNDDPRFEKSGRVAVVQLACDEGASKVLGANFSFQSAAQLVGWVPKVDPTFAMKNVPDGRAAAGGMTENMKFGIVVGMVTALLIGLALRNRRLSSAEE